MKKYLLLFACSVFALAAQAQFTNDSLLNVKIQDVSGSDQVTPLMASRADGGAYISWFDQSSGSYVLRMQRLDALGNKLWGVNGIVVSNAAQNTALYRYDLKTDLAGNAIVAFQDQRTGGMQIVVQKLDSAGNAFFATNGIVLMDADAAEGLSPTVGALGNGNIIVAWNAYSSSNAKWVSYFELDGITGAPTTGTSPQRIKSTTTGTGYSRPYILSFVNNQYYLFYVKETGSFPFVSTMFVQKNDSNYISMWANPVQVSSKTISAFFFPTLISDGSTGFTIAFNTSNPSSQALTSVYVQHIDSAGTKWSGTGTPATSSTGIQSYLGGYFHGANNETWVALQVTNTGQSAAGNSLQRVDGSGANLLGTDGVVVDAQTTNIITTVGCTANNADAIIVYYVGLNAQQKIKAVKVDSMGTKLWAQGQVTVCATLSNKDDISITPFINHSLIVTWTDTRLDNGVYSQNLNDDGSLGPLAVGIATPVSVTKEFLFENPSQQLTLQFTNSRSGSTELSVYSVEGKLVFTKKINQESGTATFPETAQLSSGVYFVRINNRETIKWVKE